MQIEEYHKKQIKKTNKKYPMMEYFLESKQLKDCSRECQEQVKSLNWQTKSRGTSENEYDIYLACADDGTGHEIMTGEPLKTYDKWLNS